MMLALRLGMTKREMLRRLTSWEISEWMAYFQWEAESVQDQQAPQAATQPPKQSAKELNTMFLALSQNSRLAKKEN